MSEEFSPGVKIVLERICEFPSDFFPKNEPFYTTSRPGDSWGEIAAHIMREKETFTDEERKAVRTALRDARRAEFDGRVIEKLSAKPEPEPERKRVAITRAQASIAQGLGINVMDYANALAKREGGPV